MKNNLRSLVMLALSMAIFGTIGPVRRALPLPSAWIAFFRGAVGAAGIVLFCLARGRRLAVPRRALLPLLASGALIGLNWVFLFEAYNYTSVSAATLCYYMAPVFVVLLSPLVLRERMTVRRALCAAAALLGMILVSGVAEKGLPQPSEARGLLCGLCAAALYAAVILWNKRLAGLDAYAKTAVQLGAAAAVLPPYLFFSPAPAADAWSARTLLLLGVVCAVHTALAYILYFGSMDGLRTQTVALFSYLDPVAALLLSAVFLNERLTPLGIAGAVLILGAAALGEAGAPTKEGSYETA